MKIREYKVLVMGETVWGKGDTLQEALDNCKKNGRIRPRIYSAFIVHPDSVVDGGGSISYPSKGKDDDQYVPKKITA